MTPLPRGTVAVVGGGPAGLMAAEAAAAAGAAVTVWEAMPSVGRKLLMAGRLGRSAMLGLPGNPVSAMVCAKLFMEPLLWAMQGLPAAHELHRGQAGAGLPANGPRAHYMRARIATGDGDLPRIRPFDRQDSALLSELSEADALLVRPPHDPARNAGDPVAWLPL